MSSNFLRLFFRNFLKFKVLNATNLIGLSLGFTAALLIALYVFHEFSFDNFHRNNDRIYRLEGKTNSGTWFSNLGIEHARELITGSYPEVEALVRLNTRSQAFVFHNNEKFPQEKVYQTSTGSRFLDLFDFEFLMGNKDQALAQPNHVVLTQSTAQKYFGDQSPLGETLNYDSILLTVSGVIADLPTHTHFDFSMVFTNPKLFDQEHFHASSYLLLSNNSLPSGLEKKILDMDVAYNEYHALSEVRLMPVADIHLSSDVSFGDSGRGDLLQIGVFIVLGLLIMSIAIVNYINLTFAIFLNKGKEVGVRKVLGESKRQIVIDLIKHSIGNTTLAIPFVFLGLYILIPVFGQFMGVDLSYFLLQNLALFLIIIIFMVVVIGLLSVVYPILALSQLDISSLIKSGLLITQSGGVGYRNMLILIQFIFLFTLGISAWFMSQQIQFLDQKDKGFDPENVIKVGNAYEIGSYDDYLVFKNELLANSQISGVAFGPMMGDGMSPLSYKTEGSDEVYENLLSYGVDMDYFDVMRIEITDGDFKRVLNAAEDGQIVSLVNESFIKKYDWENDPIGRKITLRPGSENELPRQVSAVFKDFHFYSFKEKITPQIISLRPDPEFINTNILVRSVSDNIQESINIVGAAWKKVQPDIPIKLTMMKEAVQKSYAKERQTGIVGIFLSLLAIVLSMSGIVGFMFYILGLKSKEIAMRKVLGASISSIIRLLNRQLFYTILIAGIIGSIGSYWVISKWLQDYAYAIQINPYTFAFAMLLVYTIVFVVVGFQTLKTTTINPAVVLKEK